MNKDNAQRKRPARQLYVPPAQRNHRTNEPLKPKCNIGKHYQKSNKTVIDDKNNGESTSDCDIISQMKDVTITESNNMKNPESSFIKTEVDEVEKEKEEMRRATEGINRKSRSIIKYMDMDSKNSLDISFDLKNKEEADLASWEDLLSENGEVKEQLLPGISKHSESDQIFKSQCYSFKNKNLEDLEHVIELYKFPSSFRTHDIIQIYSDIQVDSMYVKWVNDTHALLVLSTPALAQRALQIQNDLIKSRPICEASCLSRTVALKNDLKPAMKRPQTVLQTARRMITSHLGKKTQLSKEILDQERKILQDAREQKRIEKQNERDAWEGNPKSAC